MARYIDADKAKHEFNIGFGGVSHAVIANQIIDNIPTADVVKVVRCKDCEHNTDNGGDCDRVLIHTHRNLVTETNQYQYFKLNYCEYGTPKEIHGGNK